MQKFLHISKKSSIFATDFQRRLKNAEFLLGNCTLNSVTSGGASIRHPLSIH